MNDEILQNIESLANRIVRTALYAASAAAKVGDKAKYEVFRSIADQTRDLIAEFHVVDGVCIADLRAEKYE